MDLLSYVISWFNAKNVHYAELSEDDRKKFSRHRKKPRSIFNTLNTDRVVFYKTERLYLLERDLFTCLDCEGDYTEARLKPDHIIPFDLAPITHMDNLAIFCEECSEEREYAPFNESQLRKSLSIIMDRNDQQFPMSHFRIYRKDYRPILKNLH